MPTREELIAIDAAITESFRQLTILFSFVLVAIGFLAGVAWARRQGKKKTKKTPPI